MNLDGWGSRDDLGGVGVTEILILIYCIKTAGEDVGEILSLFVEVWKSVNRDVSQTM